MWVHLDFTSFYPIKKIPLLFIYYLFLMHGSLLLRCHRHRLKPWHVIHRLAQPLLFPGSQGCNTPSPIWCPCPSYYRLTRALQCVPLPRHPSCLKSICFLMLFGSCSWVFFSRIFFFFPCSFLHCLFLIKTVVWSSRIFRWWRGCGHYEESEVLTVSQFCLLVSFYSCYFWIILHHFSGK